MSASGLHAVNPSGTQCGSALHYGNGNGPCSLRQPTGNLDTKSADTAIEMMRQVNRVNRTTFLIVTHSMDIAHRCDRIVEVVDGQIVKP